MDTKNKTLLVFNQIANAIPNYQEPTKAFSCKKCPGKFFLTKDYLQTHYSRKHRRDFRGEEERQSDSKSKHNFFQRTSINNDQDNDLTKSESLLRSAEKNRDLSEQKKEKMLIITDAIKSVNVKVEELTARKKEPSPVKHSIRYQEFTKGLDELETKMKGLQSKLLSTDRKIQKEDEPQSFYSKTTREKKTPQITKDDALSKKEEYKKPVHSQSLIQPRRAASESREIEEEKSKKNITESPVALKRSTSLARTYQLKVGEGKHMRSW